MMQLTFVGCGVSCAVPVIGHLENHSLLSGENTNNNNNTHMCCCAEAASNLHSKNRRNNVSLLITLPKKDDGMDTSNKDSLIAQYKKRISILIDCGKTFRDAYFSVLASIPLHYVDALLLTHGHADAMQCVEEVVALHEQTGATVPEKEREQLLPLITHLPTFLTPNTLREVLSVSSGLAAQMAVVHDPQQAAAKEALSMTEGEIALQLHVLPDRTCVRLDPFLRDRLSALDSHGSDFPIYAVPVEHGKNYMSLGFVFGTGVCFVGEDNNDHKNGSCIVYLSDMSAHTDVSVQFLQSLTKIDVLVIDLLAGKGKASPAHYCWDDIFPCVYEMLNETNAPKKIYCVGMFCSLEYEESNEVWKTDLGAEKEAIRRKLSEHKNSLTEKEITKLQSFLRIESVELAYDGLVLETTL